MTGVELIEGGSIDAELCLIATGIVPNSELAEAAGLDVGNPAKADLGGIPRALAGRKMPR